MLTSSSYVTYERNGPTALIRLNRPDRMNSLGRELVADLEEAWQTFIADDDARVAIYTGTGRAFCAGRDIKENDEVNEAEIVVPFPPVTIFHAGGVPKPVIAAVNGFAIGGGFFDVLRCDLRVAGQGAFFQLAEISRSVLPNAWLEGIAGPLSDCLMAELGLGARITAQRAYEVGLLNRVVPDEDLFATAQEMADGIVQLPPLAVARILEGLRRVRALRERDAEFRAWQIRSIRELRESEDHHEAVASFLEKRQPVYKGR